ncbi:uncharacterized protein LOC100571960 [Acyrthosiphon pisum]|uniref:DUF4806 domain-containing protein n=1 Tax=Acyrthosiphon pisum TaxID=7029 RepID=A0A8R2D2J7_ACYPI|nr:uncharacterized protein LOC100571960 [Acyrthosiphon pisum]|eukprot:XP_016658364.1 PREDICTED: uncharacterized protein LOC100571960 [Acyrthosiphon pisum]
MENNLLSEDLDYTNKLVTAFIFASEGKTITKITNSLLRTVISDDLAKEYSWKGQKNKNAFKDLTISKIIIDAVFKKFSNIQDCKQEIKRSIMTWLAQAPTRIIRFNTLQKKNKQTTV